MGTRGRNINAPRIFMGSGERTSFLGKRETLPSPFPYLQTRCFQGLTMLTRTENASWARPHFSESLIVTKNESAPRLRNFDHITFLAKRKEAQYARVLCRLGSTNPCTNAVHMEP